jgi:TRAP-type C4-dicarboxylate transport system permease small subunit
MWIALLGACAAVAAFIIGAAMLLVGYDVIARNLELWSPSWIVDVTEYALPLATLLVAPWLTTRGEHIRIDMLVSLLPERWANQVDRATHAACGLVAAIVAWYGVGVTTEAYETEALVIKNVTFPEWYVYTPLPFCFALIAVECIRRAIGVGRTGERSAHQAAGSGS